MKKILIAAAALFISAASIACDICGCSVSNYNPFLFPQLSKKFVGLSYQHRVYTTHKGASNESNLYFNSFTLTGQYSIGKKIQAVAMLPYQSNNLQDVDGKQNTNGLGDVSLLINYKVWEKLTKAYRQTLTAGAGIKLATGKYNKTKTEEIDKQNFQLGTGSNDLIINGSYLLSYRKLVFNAAASYKYNTQNKDDYRFGDVFTTSATAIYRKDFTNISIAPYIQFTNEKQLQDATDHVLIDASGGYVFTGGGGIDVNTTKVAAGINYQLPLSQNLAKGAITVKPRISAHISFTL